MMYLKLSHYILTLTLLSNTILGQNVIFRTSAGKSRVSVGERFEITFSLNKNGVDFVPPNLTKFKIFSGPGISHSVASANGKTAISTVYAYELIPLQEGNFTIGPATIVVNGYRISSNAVMIKVIRKDSINRQNLQITNVPDSDAEISNTADLGKYVFIKTITDKNSLFKGEQLILRYKLYSRIEVEDHQIDAMPELNGFWAETIDQGQLQPKEYTEIYKGKTYRVSDIKSVILFPQQPGDITIGPLSANLLLLVHTPSKNFFDQYTGAYKEMNYKAKSNSLTIHVRPLPSKGRPMSFTGAVGKFNISAEVDKTTLKTNDLLNYRIEVSGSGDIMLLKDLNTHFPPGFEKNDPKIKDTVIKNDSGVSGSRFYNYLLIPRHEGDFNIEPFEFSYFDPAIGKYSTIATKPFKIKVDKSDLQKQIIASFDTDKYGVPAIGLDIRGIKTTADVSPINGKDHFFGSFAYYILIFIGPVLCVGTYFYKKKLVSDGKNITKIRTTNAGKAVHKHLENAEKYLKTNNPEEFYKYISAGLYRYLSNKLNIQYADISKETIASSLRTRSLSEQLIKQLIFTLELCEAANYAAAANIPEAELFEKARSIIDEVENEI